MTEREQRYEPVTLGEIKELAEVGRPTVSNWRRRHDSFPSPVGGTESKPLFDAEAIAEWLDERPVLDSRPRDDGRLPTYGERFRRGLRLRRLVTLRHEGESAERLITQALATVVLEGRMGQYPLLPDDVDDELYADQDAADARVTQAARDLVAELGSTAAAADAVLGLAERLESDLAMDVTPPVVARLVGLLAGAEVKYLSEASVLNLCAGTGELLIGLGVVCTGGTVAVEPHPLRRKLLRYRLWAHGRRDVRDVARLEDVTRVRPRLRLGDTDGSAGSPAADLVIADPPYASGERDRDEDGPLGWALEAVRRLEPGGRAFVVVPSWTLSRPRAAAAVTPTVRMREELLARDAVAAIVQLPRRIHPFRTGAEHAVLALRTGDAVEAEDRGQVLLVDADRIARRVGGEWPEYVAAVLRTGRSPVEEEARRVPVEAVGPRAESLLDGRSVLPAHRLASSEPGLDHFDATLDARREVAAVLPRLKDWIGNLGVAKRGKPAEVRHQSVGEYLRGGQLKLLSGHRIKDSDLGDAGLMVVGREEMLGTLPLGQRRIAVEDLARYPQAVMTEQGDVFLLSEYGVRTRVDDAGGCVLLAPVQGLRITAYRQYLTDLAEGSARPDSLWIRPYPLARLLAAPRNQQRGSGSLVRRVSVRDMDLPQLPPEEIAELEAVLAETDRRRAEVRRQLEALDTLAERLAAGVADGHLALRRRPGSG